MARSYGVIAELDTYVTHGSPPPSSATGNAIAELAIAGWRVIRD